MKVDELKHAIAAKYKSLETPNFSFIAKAAALRPYEDMLDSIRSLGYLVKDNTDLNEDACRSLLIVHSEGSCVLQVSFVLPIAILLTIDGQPEMSQSESVNQIRSILSAYGIEQGNYKLLEEPIAFDGESTPLYRILFSRIDRLPWQN